MNNKLFEMHFVMEIPCWEPHFNTHFEEPESPN